MYFRLGHVQNVKVKKGDRVVKGQVICEVGDGNGQYKGASVYAHWLGEINMYNVNVIIYIIKWSLLPKNVIIAVRNIQ